MALHWKSCFILSLCFPLLAFSRSSSSETFDEELTVRAMRDGKVASRFSFSTLLEGATPRNPQNLSTEDDSQHYTLFPLTLGQILREYAVTELHLTLNAGKWDYERWGYPDEPDVGTGAELWAWMGEGGSTTVDLRTTSPVLAFAPQGGLPDWEHPHAVRHASLPSEHVCTENLTPFLKLLPCKARAGIARLLNPHRLFDADWHGMGLHVVWLPDAGMQVRLTFQSVADPLRPASHRRDWSFASIFDRTIDTTLSPQPASLEADHAVFDLAQQDLPLNVSMRWDVPFLHAAGASEAPLSVRRTLLGPTQDYGMLAVSILNAGPATVRAAYLETMPWIVTFYLHTLVLRVDGELRRASLFPPPLLYSLHSLRSYT
ncbi:Gpi16 subunit, GPI transamidase component-domain-containing protein [Mycena rosella]|uniref:Gpi16 subunit, GPI transamidase component-domain-containing protein n=1 Tax=Mycena rosella TaxID=1033263 RepID=A0AAD7GFW2_MYCRO|nr:Gpi16 subunit, GPI transamidase component-domain-containing protein [Mycena rosella]